MKSIKKILSCLIVLALCVGILPIGALAQNEPLKVAFIGNTTHKNPQIVTYANRVFNYLQGEYPSYNMELFLGDPLKLENENFLDAVDSQIAQHNPDVIFIELNISTRYALSEDELTSRTEAVVKHLSSNGNTPTIYFIYTPERTMFDFRAPFDKVAKHYGITVLDVFSMLKTQYEKDEFEFIDFLTAGVVPSEAAHEHYERIIKNELKKIKSFISPIKGVSSLTDTSKYKVSEPTIDIPEAPTDTEVSLTIYVSPSGSDKNSGTIDSPLKSLEAAKSKIRVAKKNMGDKFKGANVYIREGIYSLPDGFVLDKEDSGSKDAPITYSAYENESVQFTNGRVLDYRDFSLVTDLDTLNRLPVSSAGKVYRYDLKAHGLKSGKDMFSSADSKKGFVSPAVDGAVQLASLFLVDGRQQEYASWPNNANSGAMMKISQKNAGINSNNTLYYDENISERWEKAENAWLYGRIMNGYAFEYYKISDIDTENKVIKTKYTGAHKVTPNYEWSVINILEELDVPGEHYMDDQYLYYYPRKPLSESEIIYSDNNNTLVTLNNTEYVTFRGINFSGAAGNGLMMYDCFYNLIDNCKFENLGTWAIQIKNTTGKNTSGKNGVINSDFRRIAAGGILIYGGDDYNLIPSEDYVYNCLFEDYSTYAASSTAAVKTNGDGTVGTPVGTKIWNNTFHNDNSTCIYIGGIKDDVRYNEIYNTLKNIYDNGVIYGSASGAWRQGAIVKNNYMHDVEYKTTLSHTSGFMAGYYSDGMRNNGNILDENVFVNVMWPIWFSINHNMTARGNLLLDNTGGGIGTTFRYLTEEALITQNQLVADYIEQGIIAPGQLEGPELLNDMLLNRSWVSYVTTGRVTDDNKDKYFLEFPWIENMVKPGIFSSQYFHIENNASFNHLGGTVIRNRAESLDTDTTFNNYLSPDVITADEGETEIDRIHKAMNIADEVIEGFNAWDVRTAGIQRPTIELGQFNTVSPYNNEKEVDAASVFFTWDLCDGADKYLLEIASDSEFKNIVYSDTTTWNFLQVKDTFSYGGKKYYWRVFATPLSLQFTGERYNINGVQSFTTAISQYVDKYELGNAIDFAKSTLKKVVEGDGFGEMPAGTRAELEKALSIAEAAYNNSRITVEEVKEAADVIKNAAYIALSKARLEEVDAYEYFKDTNNVLYKGQLPEFPLESSMKNPAIVFENGSTTMSGVGGMTFQNLIPTHQILRFTLKIDVPNKDYYIALISRANIMGEYSYRARAYAVLFRDGAVELQSFNPPSREGAFVEYLEYPEFKAGQEHDVEIATISCEDGESVRLILRIDGKVVFNKIHDYAPHLDAGYFAVYHDSLNTTTTIMKAKTNAPYPSLLELVNDPESEIYKQQ